MRMLTLVLLIGCKKADPAPADLDGLFHYFWTGYDSLSDEEVAAAVVQASTTIGANQLDKAESGTLTDLSEDALLVDMDHSPDPSLAAGMYLLNTIDCDLDPLEEVLYYQQQDELFDDYNTYQRTYTTSLSDYTSRKAPTLSWDVFINATMLGATYEEELHGGMRYIPAIDDETTPFGPMLLARTWMPTPAVFEDGNKTFDQDYQIEIYWARDDGQIVHMYGLWRQMFLGTGLSTDDNVVVTTMLNGLEDWDTDVEGWCQSGVP